VREADPRGRRRSRLYGALTIFCEHGGMEIVIGIMLFCFDIAGLLALGHVECGWTIPLLDRQDA